MIKGWIPSLTVGMAVAAFGCAQKQETPGEATATTRQEIWRGTPDNALTPDPYRNAIVKILGAGGSCTGFYVTSRLILTANHCITGSDVGSGVPANGIGAGATILIGNDSANPEDTSRKVRFVQTRLNRMLTEDDYDLDLALLEAFPPVVDIVFPQKPRFVLPSRDGNGSADIDVLIGGWGLTETGSAPRFRQLQFINDDARLGPHARATRG